MRAVFFISLVLSVSGLGCASGCSGESLQPPCRPITTETHGDFSKPECTRELEDKFMSPSQAPPPVEQGTQISRKLHARDYMVPTLGAKQSWIFEDEPFVVDGRIWFSSSESPRLREYDVVVLKDYTEIVPVFFDVVESKDAYIHEDEIAALPEEALAQHHITTLENHIPFNFMIGIPPSQFPERGAYELQVLFFRHNPDAPSSTYINSIFVAFEASVFVHSEEPRPNRPNISSREHTKASLNETQTLLVDSLGLLVSPNGYAPENVPLTPYFDPVDGAVLYVSQTPFSVEPRAVYVVFEDREIADVFTLPEPDEDVIWRVPFALDRQAHPTSLRAVKFPNPFTYGNDNVRPTWSSNEVRFANP